MTAKKRSSGSVKKAVKKVARKAVKTAKVAKKEVKRSATTIARAATGSKKKKASKKPAVKKTVSKKSSAQKIFPKKRPAKPVAAKKTVTPVLNLINSGANLLKKAVVKTEEGTAEGRRVVKSEGLDLIDKTSKTLHSLITGTSDVVSDGLKKL